MTTHAHDSKLNDAEQILRLSSLALAMNCGPADALEVFAWLHGWHEYGSGSELQPELITSRLAAISDADRLAAHGRAILDTARIAAIVHSHDTAPPPAAL